MTARARIPAPQQDELPLSSIAAHTLFPGRTTLYVSEVAAALRCTENHVINLIEEYEASEGRLGLKGFSIARGLASGAKTPRSCWRVAVSDYDAFVSTRRDSHTSL